MRRSLEDFVPGQAIAAEALTRVFVLVAGVTGLIFLVVAALTRQVDTMAIGLIALIVGVVGRVQRVRSRPQPLFVLAAASGGSAAILPFIDRAPALVILPALALYTFVGALSLPRRTALRFALWCGLLAAWSVPWLLPDVTMPDLVISLLLLGAVGTVGWRLLGMATEALIKEEEAYRLLFNSSPVAMLEEDFTAVETWLERLRASSIDDLRAHLSQHPEEVRQAIPLIGIRRANPAAARMIEAGSADAVVDSFGEVGRQDSELNSFIEQFVAIWEGRREVALDLDGMTFEGRPLEAVLHWSVPVNRGRPDFTSVIVTISDITPRKDVEKRLAEAIETNARVLAFEHALVACSRALLLSTGENALQVALQALREAIGADRAYLALNVEDADLGPCFRVINSASKPEFSRDDWVGMVVPWSKYPMALKPISQGESFRYVASGSSGRGWNRSLLAVPVASGGRWVGTVGFVDIARQTQWSEEAVRMLEIAAPMLGTFWERETTRKRLEDLVESKDRFVASVSHELRTPLAAVLGFAEELKTHAGSFQPDELTEMLELIAEQSQDMSDMVEDLLVAARAEVGKISVRLQDVYLRAQAESALAAIGSGGITTVRVVGGPGKAWADPTRTRQIIRNLLTNAIRYGGNEVVIEARTDGALTVLSVRDDGPGLPQAEWERIFEPYQRAHDRPTQPASIGLGLTVSRQLAHLMGGDLIYRSNESGSNFELTLPSHPAEKEKSETARSHVATASTRG